MSDEPVIKFVVGNRATGMAGYTWRINTHGTSFYLRPTMRALTQLKISLHGPDPRPGLVPSFEVKIDQSAEAGAAKVGGVAISADGGSRWKFPGRPTDEPRAQHVLTVRSTWDLFQYKEQSGPVPKEPRASEEAWLIPMPDPLYAADVDLYISTEQPYWRDEQRARADAACLGPIRNVAGQYLTGVSVRRPTMRFPTPSAAFGPEAKRADDAVRGIGTAIGPDGVLWIVEQMLSRSALSRRAAG
ncbi:MAG: hypothetical protein M3Y09_02070 [Actinomycetota bacterium]|nr:hypothetical protein [Actinomycetota bacterium]MDQ2894427.1 hypothetical protein [Actinomycetota bacterium]